MPSGFSDHDNPSPAIPLPLLFLNPMLCPFLHFSGIGCFRWLILSCREIQRRQVVKASLGHCGGDYLSTCQNCRRGQLGKSMYRAPRRDPNTVDVDAVAVGEGSENPNWRERRGGLCETERKKRQATRR